MTVPRARPRTRTRTRRRRRRLLPSHSSSRRYAASSSGWRTRTHLHLHLRCSSAAWQPPPSLVAVARPSLARAAEVRPRRGPAAGGFDASRARCRAGGRRQSWPAPRSAGGPRRSAGGRTLPARACGGSRARATAARWQCVSGPPPQPAGATTRSPAARSESPSAFIYLFIYFDYSTTVWSKSFD